MFSLPRDISDFGTLPDSGAVSTSSRAMLIFYFQMILQETTLLFISGNSLYLKLILTFHLKGQV